MVVSELWPAKRVVATLPGSLPMGGVQMDTPIFAFEQPAAPLQFEPNDLPRTRHELDIGGQQAWLINDVVSAQEANAIIEATEFFGYQQAAPGISTPPGMRQNKSVHWIADGAMMQEIFRRIAPLLPQQVHGRDLYPRLSHRVNMYRYDENDVFNKHVDGDWPGYGLSEDRREMVQWEDAHSCFSMLLYLNDQSEGIVGGETRLYRPDGSHLDVCPRKGAALFFRHGFSSESVPHEGRRILGPSPKYVARINVMYELPSSASGNSVNRVRVRRSAD